MIFFFLLYTQPYHLMIQYNNYNNNTILCNYTRSNYVTIISKKFLSIFIVIVMIIIVIITINPFFAFKTFLISFFNVLYGTVIHVISSLFFFSSNKKSSFDTFYDENITNLFSQIFHNYSNY